MTNSAEKLLREIETFLRNDQHGHWPYVENGFQAQDMRTFADRITAHLSAHPVTGQDDANGGWISVADRLPTVLSGDSRGAVLRSRDRGPAQIVHRELVKEGYGDDYWREIPRLPAAPMIAASGIDKEKP